MALSFNPVNVNLPTPPSYAAPAMGAPVDSNLLSTMAELTNIQSTQQGIATSEQALKKAKATFEPEVARVKAESQKSVIETELKGMDAATKKQLAIGSGFISQIYDPLVQKAAKDPSLLTADERKKLVDSTMEWGMRQGAEAGVDKATTARLVQPYLDIAQKNPEQLGDYLKSRHILSLSPESRTAAISPSYVTNATGQIVGVNPLRNEMSLPTEVNQAPPVNQANAPMPAQNAPVVRQPTLNPTTAQATMVNAASKTMAEDFNKTQMEANEAQPRIATFQNIKKLVPDAYTGVGGERKKFLTGLANAVNIDINTLENSTTDELAKNSAILQLAGGNTDAARAIASIANPSGKMTKDAIINITDQMIGMEKLKEAKANFLAPVSNDPVAYQRKLSQFNLVNDYRIFQESNPEQIKKLKASMSQEEQNAISAKIKLARQMGLIR